MELPINSIVVGGLQLCRAEEEKAEQSIQSPSVAWFYSLGSSGRNPVETITFLRKIYGGISSNSSDRES